MLPLQTPALRSIGNIVSGSDVQTQAAIDAGVLAALPLLMKHPKASVQKEAAWAVSNIAAGPCQQIQQLITCGLIPPLVDLLRNVNREDVGGCVASSVPRSVTFCVCFLF